MRQLVQDANKFLKECDRLGKKPALRLNGTSDIDYRKIANEFPNIQFYDYTKVYNRVSKEIPKNYHLTISYSEANKDYAKNADTLMNIIKDLYLEYSNIDYSKLDYLLDHDLWLNSSTCKEYGLVDIII